MVRLVVDGHLVVTAGRRLRRTMGTRRWEDRTGCGGTAPSEGLCAACAEAACEGGSGLWGLEWPGPRPAVRDQVVVLAAMAAADPRWRRA